MVLEGVVRLARRLPTLVGLGEVLLFNRRGVIVDGQAGRIEYKLLQTTYVAVAYKVQALSYRFVF